MPARGGSEEEMRRGLTKCQVPPKNRLELPFLYVTCWELLPSHFVLFIVVPRAGE